MPSLQRKVCAGPGCYEVAAEGSHLCTSCCNQYGKTNWANWQQRKGSRQDRGYDAEWERIRKQVLARDHHLCQEHRREGRVKEGNIVDHVVPKNRGGTNALSNLEVICKEHHDAKTARERAEGQGGG